MDKKTTKCPGGEDDERLERIVKHRVTKKRQARDTEGMKKRQVEDPEGRKPRTRYLSRRGRNENANKTKKEKGKTKKEEEKPETSDDQILAFEVTDKVQVEYRTED